MGKFPKFGKILIMDYLNQKLDLNKVNKKDEVLGKVERWIAHQEGILHRGFTVSN